MSSDMVGIAMWLLAAPLIVLTGTFVVELVAGLRPPTARASDNGPQPTRTVIVMPANDEAQIIVETLSALMPQLPSGCTVLVVADNCTDATAALAVTAGAAVLERHDATSRGKGFALAYARDHLALAPPDSVIVLDADCRIDRASIAALAAAPRDHPLQATYLLSPEAGAAPMVQVSNFAFAIKNLVRQRGLSRLAGRVNLTGTGMGFPWPIFRDAPLATDDIVEDLALGLHLAAQGNAPLEAPEAIVWSVPSGIDGTLKQRTRWEGGYLATARAQALPALARAIAGGKPRDAWAALSLAVPPLTLLLLLDLVMLVVLAALSFAGATAAPAVTLAALVGAAVVALVIAWQRVGRPFLSAGAAMRLPLYVLWKLPLYLRLVAGRPTAWLRPGR